MNNEINYDNVGEPIKNTKKTKYDYLCINQDMIEEFLKLTSQDIKEVLKQLDTYLNKTKLRKTLALTNKELRPFQKAFDTKNKYRVFFNIQFKSTNNFIVSYSHHIKLNVGNDPFYKQQRFNTEIKKIEDKKGGIY